MCEARRKELELYTIRVLDDMSRGYPSQPATGVAVKSSPDGRSKEAEVRGAHMLSTDS